MIAEVSPMRAETECIEFEQVRANVGSVVILPKSSLQPSPPNYFIVDAKDFLCSQDRANEDEFDAELPARTVRDMAEHQRRLMASLAHNVTDVDLPELR